MLVYEKVKPLVVGIDLNFDVVGGSLNLQILKRILFGLKPQILVAGV